VARFWPTITKPEGRRMATGVKLALYAGNLGIAHDTAALVAEMNRRHAAGWTVDFYGDGPRLDALPSFVRRHGFVSGDDYLDILYGHPVHLVAGTLGDGTGAFPSKAVNSLHIGAEVVPCGYAPELLAELEELKAVPDLTQNLEDAAELISAFVSARRT
ncbi:MAG: hypothetical protein LBS56_10085, partial [Propionibacteriaceae bacterium]|jgi:hypothetical protein|nr:hypothetical protein [Propionibacteriaceae bacterium]